MIIHRTIKIDVLTRLSLKLIEVLLWEFEGYGFYFYLYQRVVIKYEETSIITMIARFWPCSAIP